MIMTSTTSRILVIDDDAICRKLIHRSLTTYGTVVEAEDGYQAIILFRDALLKRQPFHLVTMDIMMPGMDGHGLLLALRSLEMMTGLREGQGVPIIMTSALNDGPNVLGSFREDATAYMTKPIDLDKLRGHCRSFGLLP